MPTAGDNAIVYFYGVKKFANGSYIYENEERIGIVWPGDFSYIVASPGKHTYTVTQGAVESMTISVEAGKEYYVKFYLVPGVASHVPHLELVPEETANALIPHLDFVRYKPN